MLQNSRNNWRLRAELHFMNTLVKLAASIAERNVTVWRPSVCRSVCLSVPLAYSPSLIETCDAASVHFDPTLWRTNILVIWANLLRWLCLNEGSERWTRRGRTNWVAGKCHVTWYVSFIKSVCYRPIAFLIELEKPSFLRYTEIDINIVEYVF